MFADQTEWTPELRVEVGADLAALREVVETSHHASRAGALAAIDALGPRVQAPPPAPVKVRAPVEVVRGAYDGDLPGPPLARSLDVALHHAVCWDGMGYPSFDYATGSQDPNPQGIAMRELPRSGGVTVDVTFKNWETPTLIHWDLLQEAGEWRVANVRGNSGDIAFDLAEGARAQVASPCGERPED